MIKNKYQNLAKEKLIEEIKQLKKKLKEKGVYGLSWAPKKEKVVEMCKEKLPVLKEVKNKGIITNKNKPVNLLIEGDNYHALSVLNYTHTKKVDVIYIDPPYNTGARDWEYNNNYVDSEDPYRHSKWLSFMSHRLLLTKNLLKDDGIICVTIDDYEMPRLWMLMEEIFGSQNHLGTVTIRNYPSGRKTRRKFAQIHEYALFFGKPKSTIKNTQKELTEKSHKYVQDKDGSWYCPTNLRKQGIDSVALRKNGELSDRFYPIYYNSKTGEISSEKKFDVEVLPIDPNGKKRIWRRGKDAIDAMFKQGDLWIQRTKFGPQVYFKFRGGLDGEPPKSIWCDSRFSASEYGTSILNQILGKRELFQYPKSVEAVKECIRVSSDRRNAIILDFFAGSGTTAQAVLELNKEDGGNRQFILVTNNENNICTDVCYPRIKKVIKGYAFKGKDKKILYERKLTFTQLKKIDEILKEINQIIEENKDNFDEIEKELKNNIIKIIGVKSIDSSKEGLGGNLKYFKTDFIDKAGPSDDVKYKLVQRSTEMLCLKESTFEKVLDRKFYKIFKNSNHFTGILLNLNALDKFRKEVAKLDGKISVYIFSLGRETYQDEFQDLKNFKNIRFQPIPESILEVYRKIFVEKL